MIKKNYRFNYFLLVYLAGIVFFTLFRLVETVVYCSMASAPDDMVRLYWHALWNGFRFDTAVSGYILALPLFLLIVGEMARITKRWYYAVVHCLTMLLYSVAFFACAADIPFFCYFSQRLDATALTLDSSLPMVVDMIVSEWSYMVYFVVFVAVCVLWWFFGRLIFRRVLVCHLGDDPQRYSWSIAIAFLLLFGLFTGIRGHLTAKRPLRTEYAVFCSNPFLNQIGLNPVFTFLKSAEGIKKDKRDPIALMDVAMAREEVAAQQQWPLTGDSVRLPEGTNVVIVLMESMASEYTSLGTKPAASLAHNLDSLMRLGITFTDAWSAGTQSYNGIYSTHYGHPAIFKRHSLRSSVVPHVCGLPQILRSKGYSTAYFMPHKGYFDGMESFMYSNGYDKVFEEGSYPQGEIVGTYGVPDHRLFHHAIEYMNEVYEQGPFYATVATCSNHSPYVLPKDIDFKPRSTGIEEQMVEYADWAIGQFMAEASRQPWFSNTLFVFVADHGCTDKKPLFDIPLARVRIPISFVAPGRVQPKTIASPACQMDVAPTILGMLGVDYDSRMLGIDIIRYRRQIAVFGTWETLGASDGEFLYIYRKNDQSSSLYRYREGSTDDVSDKYPDRKTTLERYAFGVVQTSYQMLQDGSAECE